MDPKVKQDKKTRRKLLQLLEAGKASDYMKGRWMAEIVGIEDEDEASALLTDLVNLGLAEKRDTRNLKAQIAGLVFSEFKITAKGTRLLAGLEAVEPLIEDERI